jgi:pimeloyl-ACP methyl ester carboxylesterase
MDGLVTTPDGRTLDVTDDGDPDGRPVIVHNGTPSTRLLYAPHVEDAKRKGIRLISYDRPGYGRSTRLLDRDIASCVGDVQTITDALGVDRFATWGFSGGGPHALASAALLPDRCVAAASLGGIAPYGADGLDYFSNMGADNVTDIKLSLADPAGWEAKGIKDYEETLELTGAGLAEAWSTLLSPVDVAVLADGLADVLVEEIHEGLSGGPYGWIDDSRADVKPWGFDLDTIRVPVQVWQGRHDRMVPFQHGEWLAQHVPNADVHLSESDGHLTLYAHRVPDVHAWLVSHF